MPLSRRGALGAAGAALLWAGAGARASTWPQRPIRLLVPFAPGGSSDIAARMASVRLQDVLQQTVIVDYRAGANGNLGADQVSRSAGEGHTFLVTDIVGLAISPAVYPGMSFDPLKDLQTVGMLTYSPHVLATHPSVQATSLAELAALSQRTPLNMATSSIGSSAHLSALQIQLESGARWQYVPYKGGAPAINDTVANQTQVLVNGFTATLPMVGSGRLKAIALTHSRRMPGFAGIPTAAESGIPGYVSGTYQGVMAPAAMPAEHVARMAAALRSVLRAGEVQQAAAAQAAEVLVQTPQQMDAFYRAEAQRWGDIARKNKVSAV